MKAKARKVKAIFFIYVIDILIIMNTVYYSPDTNAFMKKLHRFLLPQIPIDNSALITDTDTIHIMGHVLKLSVGEECIVFADGSDDYVCKITEITKKAVSLDVIGKNKKLSSLKVLTACISITKRDNFELAVQKLTELGVHRIVPIISDRTIKQALRIERLQKISNEALELSGGSNIVIISEPIELGKALEMSKDANQCYFDIDGQEVPKESTGDFVFYIGPEGGWSDADKALLKKYSVKSYKLTETTLRAETAAIVATYTLISK
jgi:16S rRNA (uracil1498-N3)-methyltransferase